MSWRARWVDWRNRLLGSERFRTWAAAFPLTRPIAHAEARAAFDLVAGFLYSQVLAACVRLGLFDLLAASAQTVDELAPRLGLDRENATLLLKAAAALDIAEHLGDGRYALGRRGVVLHAEPGVLAMVAHHHLLYDDLRDPVGFLRARGNTHLSAFWPYTRAAAGVSSNDSDVAAYSALMTQSQAMIARQVLDAYPLAQHRALLDVCGGEGAFLEHVARRAPHLALTLFEMPAVSARAASRLATRDDGARIRIVSGDVFRDAWPTNIDLITFIRVMHDHHDERALALLKCAHAALSPRGVVLIAEPLAQTSGAEAVGDVYFALYFAAMGQGRARTRDEISALLRKAQFSEIREIRTATPLIARVIVARRL